MAEHSIRQSLSVSAERKQELQRYWRKVSNNACALCWLATHEWLYLCKTRCIKIMKSKILLEITVRDSGVGIREVRRTRREKQVRPSQKAHGQGKDMAGAEGNGLAKHEGNVRYKTINMGKKLKCRCHFCTYIFCKK